MERHTHAGARITRYKTHCNRHTLTCAADALLRAVIAGSSCSWPCGPCCCDDGSELLGERPHARRVETMPRIVDVCRNEERGAGESVNAHVAGK